MPRLLLAVGLLLTALALLLLGQRARGPRTLPSKHAVHAPPRPTEAAAPVPALATRVEQPSPRHSWVVELRDEGSDRLLAEAYGFIFRRGDSSPPIELDGGRHRLSLPPGAYDLFAGAPGRHPQFHEVRLDGDRVQSVSLSRPARLEVRVVHHGRPVACEGTLLLCSADDPQILRDLAQRSFRAEGAALAAQIPVPPTMRRPSLQAERRLDRGSLQAFFDQPLSWSRYWDGDGRRQVPVRQGRAVLDTLPVGRELRLLLWPLAGYTDAVLRTAPLQAGSQTVEMEVAPAGLLTGRVRWRGGPVAGATVHLWGRAVRGADGGPDGGADAPPDPDAEGISCTGCEGPRSDVDDVCVRTDTEGCFAARVDRRRVRVLVLYEPPDEPGLGLAHYCERRFDDAAMQVLDIELSDRPRREGRIDQLSTRVLDDRGRPLAGAWVSLGVLGPQARSDAQGRVRLCGLAGLPAHHRDDLDPDEARQRNELLCVEWEGPGGRRGSLGVPFTLAGLERRGGQLPPLTLHTQEDVR